MTLADLIQKLKTATEGKELSFKELDSLIDGRIEFPDGFKPYGDAPYKRLSKGFRSDVYHLTVSGSVERTKDEVQPVLDELFSRAKSVKIDKGTAKVEYKVLWTPEAFQEERRLTGLFFDEVEVESSSYTCDTTQMRIGVQGQSHRIRATTQKNRMVIEATGKYRGELEDLIERYSPQIAKLNLSKEDAERLLRATRRSSKGINIEALEKALKQVEKDVISLSQDRGISFGKQEVIEITAPTNTLHALEEAIGKPLIDSKKESRVTQLIKIYGLGATLKGERLSDLQFIARDIPLMDLGIIYGHPMITDTDARKILNDEIALITRSYKEMFLFGMNSHIIRGPLVKRLAMEHFGEEVLNGFKDASPRDYVNFMKSRGYVEPTAEEFESNGLSGEPDYQQKERHLLEFFKQSYAKDTKESVQRFREFYQNTATGVVISASSKKDASKLSRLKIPSKSRLYRLQINEDLGRKHRNYISIGRHYPSDKDIDFFSTTSLDSPILLPLQEYVCREMGIKFK